VRIYEPGLTAAAKDLDGSDDVSEKLSDESSRESSEEAITKESFSRLIKAFEISGATHPGKAGSAANDKVEVRTVSTMSHGTVKETRILPPTRSSSSLANVKSVLENNLRSSSKRPCQQETRILPPDRDMALSTSSGSDSERNRSASSTLLRTRTPLPLRRNNLARSMIRGKSRSKIVRSTADEVVFMGESVRQPSESDHLIEALRHVKEELHLQNPDYFADGDADSDSNLYSNTRFESESGSDDVQHWPPLPGYASEEEVSGPLVFASPAQQKRVDKRTIHTLRTGKGKSPVKPRPRFFVNLISDDEGESQEKEVPRPLIPAAKYVPVDNSGFAAYAQTNRYMGSSQAKRQCMA
jgi:hypothetical protein